MDTRHRKLLSIGLLANIFEWYEFSIVGFLASFMGNIFFSSSQDAVAALIKGLMLFTTSYLVRPIGAVFFGWLGNQRGHGVALRYSLILMAFPTIMIGVLPTYQQAGSLGIVFFIGLRLLQGFAAGGELPNSGCYVFENASTHYKSILSSALVASGPLGMLLGSFVTTLLFQYFDETAILSYAWRIPFLLSIPLSLYIFWVRQSVEAVVSTTQSAEVISKHWKLFISQFSKAFALVSFETVGFYLLFIEMPTYASHVLGIPASRAFFIHTLSLCISMPCYFLGGYLAQRFGYETFMRVGLIGLLFSVLPLFKILQWYQAFSLIFVCQVGLFSLYILMHSSFSEMLMRLFPEEMRSFGVSLAWSIPPAYIGSTTPLVCTYVMNRTGWTLFPAFYWMAFGLIALPVAWRLQRKTKVVVGQAQKQE